MEKRVTLHKIITILAVSTILIPIYNVANSVTPSSFNMAAFQKEVSDIKNLYMAKMQDPTIDFNEGIVSWQLDNALRRYKNNQQFITGSFLKWDLSFASIARACVALQNRSEFQMQLNNPMQSISIANLFEVFLNGTIDLQQYKQLVQARVSLATAELNPGTACNEINQWVETLGTYLLRVDRLKAQKALNACGIK